MYRYDQYDHAMVQARVEEFRRQMNFGITLGDHVRGLNERQVGC